MNYHRQKGVVLIIAMVLLLVVTLLGVAVMQGSSLEMKMANNSQERQQAFNTAEATLREAELYIDGGSIHDADLRSSGCSGATCFTSSCGNNGRCFSGTYTGTPSGCSVHTGSGVPSTSAPWEDSALNVWGTASKHTAPSVPLVPGTNNKGKYIIEFRCFIASADGTNAYGDALFRITAQGVSSSGNVTAMVQGTYRTTAPY